MHWHWQYTPQIVVEDLCKHFLELLEKTIENDRILKAMLPTCLHNGPTSGGSCAWSAWRNYNRKDKEYTHQMP